MVGPKAPRLRGLPKIHKKNMPVHPLVNFTSAPSYKIAKKTDKILRQYIVFNENYSLKNSLELVDFTVSDSAEEMSVVSCIGSRLLSYSTCVHVEYHMYLL